ncbi:MAG TPA: DEAD/DEAH box helicase [Thermoanaerobaculia bacterium]|jgi:ATP-dependent RNA helicase DeaD|nr:DEAD/DEAH box helicase [Thermoanaerobaculia bacterium]
MPTEETTASPIPASAPKPAAFSPAEVTVTFRDLNLSPAVLRVLDDVGYESPTPIQAATIPRMLAGEDVVGQAQTGTGKTAAFALPILTRLTPKPSKPQALVLTPTRELAIQVAEAFQRYASHVSGFHVLPIYGGQSYVPQLSALRRGVHVVVGTPGRILDHLERGSLDLSGITTLVLDEADEMLRMGFIDDVETILKKTPPERQVALFSATMPAPIRRIAKEHLKNPIEVTIRGTTTNAPKIRQRYWLVSGLHKLDALTRILEVEPFEAMIVFARTKLSCAELAERLEARGFAAAPIHGDMQQAAREKTIARLRDGQLDILVATDVAARGLDVDRVSHVLNYDIPHDTEAYIHRIGRTGRAGRSGDAILFLTPRERHMLAAIERATRQTIQPMELPSVDAVNDQRIEKFKRQITETLENDGLELFQKLVEQYEQEHNVPAVEIAAALARMAHGDAPLLLEKPAPRPRVESVPRPPRTEPYPPATARTEYPRSPVRGEKPGAARSGPAPSGATSGGSRDPGLASYRVEVGLVHGVKPGNLVGAITNEAGLESRHIGKIDIRDNYSLVDLPVGLSTATLKHLQNVRVAGQRLAISRERDLPKPAARPK